MKLDLQRFATTQYYEITINFDSNVTSVVDNNGYTFNASGESKSVYNQDVEYTFTVGMPQGYELDSVTSNYGEVSNVMGNSFRYIQETGHDVIITITTKATTTQKSVDLTTLSGWNELSDGTHNITIVAKGTGYSDSEESDSVQVTKSSGETWVLNDSLYDFNGQDGSLSNFTYNINFKSNNNNYTIFKCATGQAPMTHDLLYDSTIVYVGDTSYWKQSAFQIVTFATAPTGALLTWLQANGTKQ